MNMILLFSYLLSVASSVAFTPGAVPSTQRQSATLLDNFFFTNLPQSILHPLNEMGVDLDDDMDMIISNRGWVDYAVNRAQISTIEQRSTTYNIDGGDAVSFSLVALLVVLEIIMVEVHNNGGTIFAQTMFH